MNGMTEEHLNRIESDWKRIGLQDWANTGQFVIAEIRRLREENERLELDRNDWRDQAQKENSRFHEVDQDHMETKELLHEVSRQNAELAEALRKAKEFYEGITSFYGQELQVYNWHMNGEPEPFDNFIDDNMPDGLEESFKVLRKYGLEGKEDAERVEE